MQASEGEFAGIPATDESFANKAIAIHRVVDGQVHYQRPVRIYRPFVAEFDQVVIEFEFADWAEMDEFWNGWQITGAEAFFATWADIALPGGRREL